MTLGTADANGTPWASPVYYATDDYRELFWVSYPEAQHSRNLAVRPELSIVVFDSQLPINTGQAVYMSARAERLADDDVEDGIAVFSRRTLAHGSTAWTAADVLRPDGVRLYRATVAQHWILRPDPLTGATVDKRTAVAL